MDLLRKHPSAELVAVAVVGLCIALLGAPIPALSGDEAATWWAAQLPWPQLGLLASRTDLNFSVYYAFIHVWMTAFGTTELVLRLPSILGGVATVLATYGLARELVGRRVAVVAAGLLLIAPAWLRYAQQARPYSWTMALVTVVTWLLVVASRRSESRPLKIAYLAGCVVLPITHLFASLIFVAHVAYAWHRKDRRLLPLVGVATVPSIVAAILVARQAAQVGWITHSVLLRAAQSLVGEMKALWFIPMFILACAGVIAAWRRRDRISSEVLLLWVWVAVPPAALWIVSALIRPLFVPRYVIWIVPALALLAAIGAEALGSRHRWVLPVVMAAALVATLPAQVDLRSPSGHLWDTRSLAARLASLREPRDALYAPDYYVALPLRYYLRADPLPEPLVRVSGRSQGTFTDEVITDDAAVSTALTGTTKLWIVDEPLMNRSLPRGFCELQRWVSRDGIAQLRLAVRCPS
jgi:mannosyltransferase